MDMLLGLTLPHLMIYSVVLAFLFRALAHALDARVRKRRLRPLAARFTAIAEEIEAGRPASLGLDEAARLVAGTPLSPLFRLSGRLRVSGGIEDQIEEGVAALFGQLRATVLANEAAGPRFGLAATALSLILLFRAEGHQIHPESLGVALVTTALGMLVALIEGWTMAHVIRPAEAGLRSDAGRLLIAATWPSEPPALPLLACRESRHA